MIKISEVVEDILNGDEIALESLRAGILNLSAYAEKIRPLVEKRLYKDIRKGSIVTALSRVTHKSTNLLPLKAEVRIEDFSIKSPLCELTFEISSEVSKKISGLTSRYAGKGFFTVTQGIGEVTFIFPQDIKDEILKTIVIKPKGEYDNLAAITTRFDESKYIEIPNMIYTMVSVLASRRINLVEIVSTFTEISFIVRQRDLKDTLEVLKDNFLN